MMQRLCYITQQEFVIALSSFILMTWRDIHVKKESQFVCVCIAEMQCDAFIH